MASKITSSPLSAAEQIAYKRGITDENSMNYFAVQLRRACIAYGATAVVLAVEAWVSSPQKDDDPTQRPSEAADRREIVVLQGECSAGTQHQFLPILRDETGKFSGFGKSDIQTSTESKGRFTHLLPATPPDLAEREAAKAQLNDMCYVHHVGP